MTSNLASIFLFGPPWGKVLLPVHLLIAAFALGTVTHHWWVLNFRRTGRPALLRRYAWWMGLAYALSWALGCFMYPAYNVTVRRAAKVGLDATAPWAVSLFEYKEHFGTFALFMLPWLVLSARRYERLGRLERASYVLAAWVFTVFVYYVVASGAVVTAVRGLQ